MESYLSINKCKYITPLLFRSSSMTSTYFWTLWRIYYSMIWLLRIIHHTGTQMYYFSYIKQSVRSKENSLIWNLFEIGFICWKNYFSSSVVKSIMSQSWCCLIVSMVILGLCDEVVLKNGTIIKKKLLTLMLKWFRKIRILKTMLVPKFLVKN